MAKVWYQGKIGWIFSPHPHWLAIDDASHGGGSMIMVWIDDQMIQVGYPNGVTRRGNHRGCVEDGCNLFGQGIPTAETGVVMSSYNRDDPLQGLIHADHRRINTFVIT